MKKYNLLVSDFGPDRTGIGFKKLVIVTAKGFKIVGNAYVFYNRATLGSFEDDCICSYPVQYTIIERVEETE